MTSVGRSVALVFTVSESAGSVTPSRGRAPTTAALIPTKQRQWAQNFELRCADCHEYVVFVERPVTCVDRNDEHPHMHCPACKPDRAACVELTLRISEPLSDADRAKLRKDRQETLVAMAERGGVTTKEKR